MSAFENPANKYERLTVRLSLGHYRLLWRLLTYPLRSSRRNRMWPFGVSLQVFALNPPDGDERVLSDLRQRLAGNPDDIGTRFCLGNVLRMCGRVSEARREYQMVAQSEHEHWAAEARALLAKLTEVPDHLGCQSMHLVLWKRLGSV